MKPLNVGLVTVCLILSATIALRGQDASSLLDQRLKVAIKLENSDARQVLSFVCKAANLKLEMSDDAKATVTVHLVMPTLREALDAITQPAGLAYTIDAGKLKVTRR
jgi:hypothetical protein